MSFDLREMTLDDENEVLSGRCPFCETQTVRELRELGHRARVFLCTKCDAFTLVKKDEEVA